jgi:peptidoglycan hydrolase-like protein with peptidoglycan-binding domain
VKVWGAVLAVGVVTAIGALAVVVSRSGPDAEVRELTSGFTTIQRQTLTSTESFTGTVRFDVTVEVVNGGNGTTGASDTTTAAGGTEAVTASSLSAASSEAVVAQSAADLLAGSSVAQTDPPVEDPAAGDEPVEDPPVGDEPVEDPSAGDPPVDGVPSTGEGVPSSGGARSGGGGVGGTGGGGGTVATVDPFEGRVTWLAAAGAEVANGDVLYKVDEVPVVFLTGSVASYRTLERGATGDDVADLQLALKDLGFDPDDRVAVDGEFGPVSEAMVERWQESLGVEVDGVVDRGEVVVRPTSVRVASVAVEPGDEVSSGTTMLELSSIGRVVELEVEAERAHLLSDGQVVDVRLPDRTVVAGEVVSIDSVVDSETGTVRVIISSDGLVGESDQAPVTVIVSIELATDELVVETEAIMAPVGDEYVVEAIEADGSRRTVPVEVGVTDGTVVVVSGDGIEEGLLVRAPA